MKNTYTYKSNSAVGTTQQLALLSFEQYLPSVLESDRTHRSPQDFKKLNNYTSSLQNGGEV